MQALFIFMKIINITKDYILSHIGQVRIFESFLGEEVDLNKLYYSPFRTNDKIPSCSFYYRSGKLRFKDFGGNFSGDCLDFVAKHLRLNINNKQHFMFTLHSIASHFGICGYKPINIQREETEEVNTKKVITYVTCEFDHNDKVYWESYGVDIKTLNQDLVFRIKLAWIDNNLLYSYNKTTPCYIYIYSNKDFRLYFPKPLYGKIKFITSSNSLQGLHLLQPNDYVIITKSMKDCLCLKAYSLKGNEISSFALGSEGSTLSKEGYKWLKETMRYKVIFTLMDYDRAGLACTIRHRRLYNTIPLYIKQETWNSNIKYDVKDISDFRRIKGDKAMKKLIEENYAKYSHLFKEEKD